MGLGIVVGMILGAFLGEVPGVGLIYGGVIAWLIWRQGQLEASIEALQTRFAALQQTKQNHVDEGAVDEDKNVKVHEAVLQRVEASKDDVMPVVLAHDTPHKVMDTSKPAATLRNNTVAWETSDGLPKYIESILAWLIGGNMLVRVGSVLLFFGAGFLLKYAAEHSQISIEVRMLGIVLGACVMLGVGWYLRVSRPVYGLALQGGGLGLLYLTIYASFRLYDLLQASHALMLLALVAGAGVTMAVIYNARWLAILSFAGGFLAPILASTGLGNHVALFSWYAVLNVGIAMLAWHKAWRSLNLLGMVATFIITALWGNQFYQPAFFNSVEPFLIGFGLLYLMIGVLFSIHRADPEQEGFGRVDASIIFGTPVGFFLLQMPLVHDFEHGMSLSALLSGLVYLPVAWLAWKHENKTLMIALLSIAATLLTLAIPLEFDEAETAAAWAMEGIGLLWLGLVQQSQRALLTGLALQILAAGCWWLGSPISPDASYGSALSAFLIALSGWVCVVLIQRDEPLWDKTCTVLYDVSVQNIVLVLQLWGLAWWLGAGLTEMHRHFHGHELLIATVLWLCFSAFLTEYMAVRLAWRIFYRINAGFICVCLLVLMLQPAYVEHPMQDWAWLMWLLAIPTAYWMLFVVDKGVGSGDAKQGTSKNLGTSPNLCFSPLAALNKMDNSDAMTHFIAPFYERKPTSFNSCEVFRGAQQNSALHVAGVCFVLLWLMWELHWQVLEYIAVPLHVPIWGDLVVGAIAVLVLLLIVVGVKCWPVRIYQKAYFQVSGSICILLMLGWFVWMLANPVDINMLYIPLLNPLDIIIAWMFVVIFYWWKLVQKHELLWFDMWHFYSVSAGVLFIALNIDIARMVHHYLGVTWNIHSLANAVEFQAAISLCWSILALVIMVWSSRRGVRILWMAGAALIALVVLKLFVIDLSNTGTLARIISFLGVGGLLLLIGYLSPIPPSQDGDVNQAEKSL